MNLMPNVHFAKNQIIFEEGYPADSVYLICEGSVQVFKKRHNEQVPLAHLEKDAIFGEMAFISDRPRSATVISVDDTWCYAVTKETFLQKLKTADTLVMQIFNDLVDTIREKNSVVAIEPLDELVLMEKEHRLNTITPAHSLDYLTHNKELLEKIDRMDLFMRQLFQSLIKIAYK